MPITSPVIQAQLETEISLEEILSMAKSREETVMGYAFTGGSVAGENLEQTEYKGCRFHGCRFTGAHMEGAFFQNCVFVQCDFSGMRAMDATMQKCELRGCKLSGAYFAGMAMSDILLENCVCENLVLSEALLRDVECKQCNLRRAYISDVKPRSRFSLLECDCAQTNFLHTALNGVDFTTCNIDGAAFVGPELKGAVVTPPQACELAKLLGVVIR